MLYEKLIRKKSLAFHYRLAISTLTCCLPLTHFTVNFLGVITILLIIFAYLIEIIVQISLHFSQYFILFALKPFPLYIKFCNPWFIAYYCPFYFGYQHIQRHHHTLLHGHFFKKLVMHIVAHSYKLLTSITCSYNQSSNT